MGNSNLLFESLFKRNASVPGTADFLTQITNDYPYFSTAQFYLLQQINEGTEDFNKQAAKTAVLFNNPYWLNLKLLEARKNVPKQNEPGVESQESLIETVFVDNEKEVPLNPIIVEVQQRPTITEPDILASRNDEKTEAFENADNDDNTTVIPDSIEAMPPVETISTPVIEEKIEAPEDVDYDDAALKEIEPIKIVSTSTVESNTTEETFAFEPLHITDYFASQGIKLGDEIKPADKLGKQLKSFTDWLKTMKKIHEEKLTQEDEQTDKTIQILAEKSNTEHEIATEAMADVLIKQGKKDKAIELYQKLSLLNPSKNTYFAAKIEQLKEQ